MIKLIDGCKVLFTGLEDEICQGTYEEKDNVVICDCCGGVFEMDDITIIEVL